MSLFDQFPEAEPGNDTGSTDPTCKTCGAPLAYSGRGRKPVYCDEHKSSSRSSSSSRGSVSSRELDLACDNLNDMYEMLVMPFTLVSPNAGAVWASQIDGLNRRNRTFLAGNKDLVKRINSAGEKAGTFGFVASHMFALAPVALVIVGDVRAARADRPAPEPPSYTAEQEPYSPPDVDPHDPDFVFVAG